MTARGADGNRAMPGDTTAPGRSWYFSLSAGFTSNTVFGSEVDQIKTLSPRYMEPQQKNRGGVTFDVGFQKYVSSMVYLRLGLGYMWKQVNPQENSYVLYKDSLKTGYLTVPFIWGISQPVNPSHSLLVMLEAGPVGCLKLVDKTTTGQDREGWQTFAGVADIVAGGGIALVAPGVRVALLYHYQRDLTDAYHEILYWGGNPLIKTNVYRYSSHVVSIGFQWAM